MAKSHGHIFKEKREELNLTLRDVADRAGIHASSLSRIEAEKQEPTLSVAADLASVLGLSLDESVGLRVPTAQKSIKRNTNALERHLKRALETLEMIRKGTG